MIDEEKMFEARLDHCKYLYEKVKLNQERSDKYFNYFLLFITAPVALLAAVIPKSDLTNSSAFLDNIGYISLFISIIGFFFFCASTMSRINRLKFITTIEYIERSYIEPYLYGFNLGSLTELEANSGDTKPGKPLFRRFATDFHISLVQMITNCFWAGAYIYLSKIQLFDQSASTPFLIVCLVLLAQLLIRHVILNKYESQRPLAVKGDDGSHTQEVSNLQS